MRLLLVSPRFGPSVVGGAETLARALVLRATGPDVDVEVATTCAIDHQSWENVLPAGEEADGDVLVHRFPASPVDGRRHARLAGRLARGGRLSYAEELELFATSGWSPALQRFVARRAEKVDLVVCTPYLFGVPFWAAHADPARTVLIPCLHDEPQARLRPVTALVRQVRGFLFNSPGERRLAERLFGPLRGGVVGMGFDPPAAPAPAGFAARHGLGRYVLFAGRIEEAKRIDVLAAQVARYRRERGSDLVFAAIGRGSWRPAARDADAVRIIGFVDEEEKRQAYAEAVALVNPSSLESLSLVLLEAWLEGTPAIVSAASDVLREHVRSSGGGLAVSTYAELAAALDMLLDDPGAGRAMGEAGRSYVEERYSWPAVSARLRGTLEELASPAPRAMTESASS